MLLRTIDIETLGLAQDSGIVEIGWQDVAIKSWGPTVMDGINATLIDPGRPIPPEASAVHHIIDDDIHDEPDIATIWAILRDHADVFVAHNSAFEQSFLDAGKKPWLCTLKASRRVWPDAPSHSLQVLRYWLKLPVDRDAAAPPHRAGPDAYVTAYLLVALLEAGATIEQMIEWTAQPSLLPRVTFGKHRGKPWSELPADYLQWLVDKSDMDVDTKFTAKHWLTKRDEHHGND